MGKTWSDFACRRSDDCRSAEGGDTWENLVDLVITAPTNWELYGSCRHPEVCQCTREDITLDCAGSLIDGDAFAATPGLILVKPKTPTKRSQPRPDRGSNHLIYRSSPGVSTLSWDSGSAEGTLLMGQNGGQKMYVKKG